MTDYDINKVSKRPWKTDNNTEIRDDNGDFIRFEQPYGKYKKEQFTEDADRHHIVHCVNLVHEMSHVHPQDVAIEESVLDQGRERQKEHDNLKQALRKACEHITERGGCPINELTDTWDGCLRDDCDDNYTECYMAYFLGEKRGVKE